MGFTYVLECIEESMKKETAEVVRQRLATLRVVLETRQDSAWLEQFDEFIREHEWELALHVVCDHLLESADHVVHPDVLDQIAALHEAMGTKDTCVTTLRRNQRK
jgi:hypothetical protein